ncbi:13156_t:CDS:2, partial [Funneliformis mosseae]
EHVRALEWYKYQTNNNTLYDSYYRNKTRMSSNDLGWRITNPKLYLFTF